MLVDLLMAVAIVGVAALATIEMLTTSARAANQTENLQTAADFCRERLEEIRNVPGLVVGTGSNTSDTFLPDLNGVSVDKYFTDFYLTESDTYHASHGTSGSLVGMKPSGRVDRITRIEWIDDPSGGNTQDYFRITVSVFWQEGATLRSFSLETLSVGN
jgi:type II secretory pathway pseudopilin PulG